jgi:hypothetical protein
MEIAENPTKSRRKLNLFVMKYLTSTTSYDASSEFVAELLAAPELLTAAAGALAFSVSRSLI